ncbi:MAG: hypothetical protein JWP25_5898 [Bradyrhizobium sp.]|nr:hypothetical protein [Bradyrhizobium sp.]
MNWCTRFCRPLRNHSATWPHEPGSIYSINRLGNRPTFIAGRLRSHEGMGFRARFEAHRVAFAGDTLVEGAELIGVRSVDCPGGSRARAMLTRQPYCETEIVPSLHSNLGGSASVAGTGFSNAAACWGAGACATGFGDKAQPAQESEINKTGPVRIRASFRKTTPAADAIGSSSGNRLARELLQHTTAVHDSDIKSRCLHGSLTDCPLL